MEIWLSWTHLLQPPWIGGMAGQRSKNIRGTVESNRLVSKTYSWNRPSTKIIQKMRIIDGWPLRWRMRRMYGFGECNLDMLQDRPYMQKKPLANGQLKIVFPAIRFLKSAGSEDIRFIPEVNRRYSNDCIPKKGIMISRLGLQPQDRMLSYSAKR